MTKVELVAQIAKAASITKKKAEATLKSLTGVIGQALKEGDKITVSYLGTFTVRKTKARIGVNPRTQAKIKIPAAKVPAFKAAKALRDVVKGTSKESRSRKNIQVIGIVANYLGFDSLTVAEISKNADKTYRKYQIPKKKGGYRSIFHPAKATKSLQYAIIETILTDLPVHHCAVGYIRGLKSPLLENAKRHAGFRYSVRIDFEDFFPSIRPRDLISVLNFTEKFAEIADSDREFLARSLFVRYPGGNVGLAIGAPSSPSVCNVIMHSLDEKINRLAISTSTDSVYTRYADDVIFSTNEIGACKRFFDELAKLVDETSSPHLKINPSKTVYTSRGTKRVITGLHVCPNGDISIGRSNKRYIRKLLFEFKNNTLDDDRKRYLSGYLSFLLDVEPDFYNRITLKYGAEVVARAHKWNPTIA